MGLIRADDNNGIHLGIVDQRNRIGNEANRRIRCDDFLGMRLVHIRYGSHRSTRDFLHQTQKMLRTHCTNTDDTYF